ncbi:hypothetical protein ACGFNF_22055 [Micromonospora sp. NPDC048868]|uniref:hypothetical protein n=1 Tax=Micromonospora sp. NPDC048868 TaxID=3364258 RepID=UPI00371D12D5
MRDRGRASATGAAGALAALGWGVSAELTNPDGIRFDLGHDLIASTVDGAGRPAR